MEEIAAFMKGAICDDQCLGRCLYIHGVPGTGKVGNTSLVVFILISVVAFDILAKSDCFNYLQLLL